MAAIIIQLYHTTKTAVSDVSATEVSICWNHHSLYPLWTHHFFCQHACRIRYPKCHWSKRIIKRAVCVCKSSFFYMDMTASPLWQQHFSPYVSLHYLLPYDHSCFLFLRRYLQMKSLQSIQSNFNPLILCLRMLRRPADDHIPLPPPLHIQHKGIPSVWLCLCFNPRNVSSVWQTSLFDLNWHARLDNRHLL